MDLAAWLQYLRRRRAIRALLGRVLISFAALQVIDPLLRALDPPRNPAVSGFELGIPRSIGRIGNPRTLTGVRRRHQGLSTPGR